ncbi:MAG: aminotransferase DegT [Omnitrophica WOR_2 bacterium GWF2_38_59]|nr:MAG: aminotransferase DegT [Omnitrophica WOR_2 bacterium GWF2_38_59]OGX48881.1 MAG: aminotransferase DegT [Omnitrophica WOR_2 bacterium RIFOXYA2_FULL_38_17]OGX52565.1 MAG: aminotransferase DegT [Omnitrophica WOR_2 bacterium RIFOXYA12_FULL_38_10]OGX56855.1 MAG: aminotransferase DegT [Omnitrophica WOR_2 bacterium RIFOXYB2_FULL_38_16]OGX57610.1 MAG: aminotransferase DegT [Omnitrophica WOR_2 bacterium RIFOXYC2_FULL_38_12]HBG60799.1 aminotransferase DegT [Candidatus Omnitrophota bacterium]
MRFIDLQTQYLEYKTEIDAQINDVISNASFIMGSKIEELEDILANYVGIKHAIGCASGTDALLLALMTYDLQPDDEIITTPFTFIATSEVISFLKAKPVFVDIKEKSYNIDPKQIRNAITSKTKGIIAVDIFGQCANYDEINSVAQENNLFVIEDAAQSFGAEYKGKKACSLTDMTCTSFFPAKPLGCYGDGGMVFTNNDKKAEKLKSLRVHGKGSHKYDNIQIGVNARLDTIQAAVLLAKFPHYKKEIELRNQKASYYTERLNDCVITPHVCAHNLSVYAQYSIRAKNRDQLQEHLNTKGIPTAVHYPRPLHLQTAFSFLGYKKGAFPISEKVSNEIVSLPMHPFLTEKDQDKISEEIISFYS